MSTLYFKHFPKIIYPFSKEKGISIVDISVNVRAKEKILNVITLYDEYDIKDGETPEIISEKIYGTPYYHWAIMLINERYDYVNDFPLSWTELNDYVTNKYGEGNEHDIHHYELDGGYVVNETETGRTPITNFEFEDRENEKKRRIKLVSKSMMNNLSNELRGLF